MNELHELKDRLNPVEILFVADAHDRPGRREIGRRIP